MTYPGLVLLVGVGVGLAAFLFYMFTENNENPRQQSYNYHGSRQSASQDDWTLHRSENGLLNKRGSSNSSTRREKSKDYSNKEEVSECTICLEELITEECIRLTCGHRFHIKCLKQMGQYYSTLRCPMCRNIINHAI